MDRTVPAPAALILDFVRDTEVGKTDRSSYDVIFGFNQNKIAKPVTSMSVGDLVDEQKHWTQRFGSSAAGGYQFMRETLIGLAAELHLNGNQVMDPNLQDRLAYHLLKRRGYEDFMAGRMGRTEFAKRLAMEWASFPVLSDTQGAHRRVQRGESYYVGDRFNKALISPLAVEELLTKVKQTEDAPPAPVGPSAWVQFAVESIKAMFGKSA